MTRDKWAALTVELRRIKVAQLCGWQDIRIDTDAAGNVALVGSYPGLTGSRWNIPHYILDLNAMYAAEQLLNDNQRVTYTNMLTRIVTDAFTLSFTIRFAAVHATAAQRAEAFALTMEWEEAA